MSSLSAVSQIVLKQAGWFPERKVDPTPWLNRLDEAGYPIFEALVNVLTHLGGITVVTTPFQQRPFFIEQMQQHVILHPRTNPVFEFLPDRAEATSSTQAPLWHSLYYLKHRSLQIAPIGLFREQHRICSLFILSNGHVFNGVWTFIGKEKDNKVPGLRYLGDTIEESINRTLADILALWY